MANYELKAGKGTTVRESEEPQEVYVDENPAGLDLTTAVLQTDVLTKQDETGAGDPESVSVAQLGHAVRRVEKLKTFTAQTGTVTLDLDEGTVFRLPIGAGSVTIAFDNGPDEFLPAVGGGFTLILVQNSTAQAITWPSGILWAQGVAPDLSTNDGVYILVFTYDGTDWYGFLAGTEMAESAE